MRTNNENISLCPLCHKHKNKDEMIPVELIHEPIIEFRQKKYPGLSLQESICLPCLNRIRSEYVQEVLETEKGELSGLEEDVIKSLNEQELLSKNINLEFEQQLTLGERVADKVAEFGGSWPFIFIFLGVLGTWIIINSLALLRQPFDPYPYILLNLVLSSLAAIQAPIIMMSQNRQAKKDRLLADHDYRTNLKAELEIRQINWKMDQLLTHHWQRLLEIQHIQTELMEEIVLKDPREES